MVNQFELPRERRAALTTHEALEETVKSRMHHEVVLLCKRLTALGTDEGTLAGMVLAVRYKVTFGRKRPVAFRTSEWLLSTVNLKFNSCLKNTDYSPSTASYLHVRQQVVFKGEVFLARDTVIWPLLGVKQEVCIEAVLVCEALAAVDAGVRPLARVRPSVSRQMVFHQERFAALLACIRANFA